LVLQGDYSVPRFYFHFSDGKRQFTDAVGFELSGLAAARKHAAQEVRDLKAAMCSPHIQDLSGWSLSVTDVKGDRVLEIGFDLRTVPNV
jgi:hypothetical protein